MPSTIRIKVSQSSDGAPPKCKVVVVGMRPSDCFRTEVERDASKNTIEPANKPRVGGKESVKVFVV